jgi:hypothetical protein
MGALALGATALGAVTIGRLAIARATIKRLVIDDLEVRRLRVVDLEVVSERRPPSTASGGGARGDVLVGSGVQPTALGRDRDG